MAKKLIGKVFGKKKKKAADTATTTSDGQPVITPLSALPITSPLKKRVGAVGTAPTILGVGGLLGQ